VVNHFTGYLLFTAHYSLFTIGIMNLLFELIWLIPLYPLLAFAIIVLGLNRSKKASAGLAIGAIILSTIHSWAIVFSTVSA
jgi:hypothetical protein